MPLHILQPASFGSQARAYSSKSDSDAGSGTPSEETKSEPATRLATAFGFQSLSGLFEQPKRGRYSSPQERQNEGSSEPPTPGNREEPETRSDAVTDTTENIQESSASPVNGVSADTTSDTDATDSAQQQKLPVLSTDAEGVGIGATSTPTSSATQKEQTVAEIGDAFRKRFIAMRRSTPSASIRPTQRRQRGPRKPNSTTENFTAGARGLRRANPFSSPPNLSSTRGHQASRLKAPGTVPSHAQNPWGLSTENELSTPANRERVTDVIEPNVTKSLDSESVPNSAKDSDRRAVAKDNPAVEKASNNEPSQKSSAASRPKKSKTTLNKNLTHLTSTGEAHMVDVGDKQSTKRIAIAISRVRFSNDQPLRLIAENNNKKGDVLSVARIAGIMAAKRTSDIIPLCHPIGISKVEVDVQPEGRRRRANTTKWRGLYPTTFNGSITIRARVECYGTTGVEMEALTAASAAALTVFDMCKAVDKEMQIMGTTAVYKSGGKSGLFVSNAWAKAMGAEWFIESGLEIPDAIRMMLNTPKLEGEREDQDVLGEESDTQNLVNEVEAQESKPPASESDTAATDRENSGDSRGPLIKRVPWSL